MFPILSTLPGVHATIVGIFLAFFSTFFMYAYQKIKEAHRNLEDAIKLSQRISTPNYVINTKNSKLIIDKNLSWHDKGKELIDKSVSLARHIISENYDFSKPISNQYTEDKVIEYTDELHNLFYLFFTCYPFQDTNNISKTWDSNRFDTIYWRVDYLNWIWSKEHKQFLIHLFYARDQIEIRKAQEDLEKRIIEACEREVDEQNKIRTAQFIRNSDAVTQSLLPKKSDFLFIFFQKVEEYTHNVLPPLKKTIVEYERYNYDFKLKKYTISFLIGTFYILIIGIIIPIILLNFLVKLNYNDYNLVLSYFEYLILTASFLPYLAGILVFIKKVNNSILSN